MTTTAIKMNKMAITEIVSECDEKFGTNLSFELNNTGGWKTLSAKIFSDNAGIGFLFNADTLEITQTTITVSTGWDFLSFYPAGTDESGNVEFAPIFRNKSHDRNFVDQAYKVLEDNANWINYVLK